MLTVVLGRAGCGKTSRMFTKIADNIAAEKRSILIVPEQYSHDAERALAKSCGNSASLYAEVLSFTRLCQRVFAETGGLAEKNLDKGGRILAMSTALSSLAANLKVYNVGDRGSDFLESLLTAYDEMKSSRVGADDLADASERADGAFGKKLGDLALIFAAYEAVLKQSGCDTADKMDRLAECIGGSSVCRADIFVDGFSDFTAQELEVLRELICGGANIQICLNTPDIDRQEAFFFLPAKTARRLLSFARDCGAESEVIHIGGEQNRRSESLKAVEENLFDYSPVKPCENSEGVSVFSCADAGEECSRAAAEILDLVRGGYRFRDIAVAAPDWGRYAMTAAEVFHKYGIPVDVAEKSDILQKPAMLFVLGAFDVIVNNWAYNDVFRYLKTGLAGIDFEECDLLENYVLKWSVRGAKAWCEKDWDMNPRGYSQETTEEDIETLRILNGIRKRVAQPISKFAAALKNEESALGKVRAVYEFLTNEALWEKLNLKNAYLREKGDIRLAEQYEQFWDILVKAMEQFADVMGEVPLGTEEFARLFRLVLSQYDIVTIPTSVDSVNVGGADRLHGRNIRHLILMGASEGEIPSLAPGTGIFSDDERDELKTYGIELAGAGEELMAREMGKLYRLFALPDMGLTVSYIKAERPSYLITRMEKMLNISEKPADTSVYMAAELPCFEYAVTDSCADRDAAEAYFASRGDWKDKLDAVKRGAKMPKERLSRLTAEKLYRKNARLSPSQVDKYYSCRFQYFMQYGLRAQPRRVAEMDTAERGTFIHFILENVARETEKAGGFAAVDDDFIRKTANGAVREYAEVNLGGLAGKSGRFVYLFRRLAKDAVNIALTMAQELRVSDFRPMDFELSISRNGPLPPVEIGCDDGSVSVVGTVDRVDGWMKDGKLYVRVVDYKTYTKEFSLSDVLEGLSLQMLIYLFAIQRGGLDRYGKEIVPAGVLYSTVKDPIITAKYDLDDEKLDAERLKKLKSRGLVLLDDDVIEAMEHGDNKKFIPVKLSKDGAPAGDSLVTLENLGTISRHVDLMLKKMGEELRGGYITEDPFYRSTVDYACVNCRYFEACHYKNRPGEKKRFLSKLKAPEVLERMEAEK